jgi:hypothetical protein
MGAKVASVDGGSSPTNALSNAVSSAVSSVSKWAEAVNAAVARQQAAPPASPPPPPAQPEPAPAPSAHLTKKKAIAKRPQAAPAPAAAPPPSPPATPAPALALAMAGYNPPLPEEISVQTGDTLKDLATQHGTTVEQILVVNPGRSGSEILHVGDVIRLPPGVSPVARIPEGTAGGTPGVPSAEVDAALESLTAADLVGRDGGRYSAEEHAQAVKYARTQLDDAVEDELWRRVDAVGASDALVAAVGDDIALHADSPLAQQAVAESLDTIRNDYRPAIIAVDQAYKQVQSVEVIHDAVSGASTIPLIGRPLQIIADNLPLAATHQNLDDRIGNEIALRTGTPAGEFDESRVAGQRIADRYQGDPVIVDSVYNVRGDRIAEAAEPVTDPAAALKVINDGFARAKAGQEQPILDRVLAHDTTLTVIDQAAKQANLPLTEPHYDIVIGVARPASADLAVQNLDRMTANLEPEVAGALAGQAIPDYVDYIELYPENAGSDLFGDEGLRAYIDVAGRIYGTPGGDRANAEIAALRPWHDEVVRNALANGADPAYVIAVASADKAAGRDPANVLQVLSEGVRGANLAPIGEGDSAKFEETVLIASRVHEAGLDPRGVLQVALDGNNEVLYRINVLTQAPTVADQLVGDLTQLDVQGPGIPARDAVLDQLELETTPEAARLALAASENGRVLLGYLGHLNELGARPQVPPYTADALALVDADEAAAVSAGLAVVRTPELLDSLPVRAWIASQPPQLDLGLGQPPNPVELATTDANAGVSATIRVLDQLQKGVREPAFFPHLSADTAVGRALRGVGVGANALNLIRNSGNLRNWEPNDPAQNGIDITRVGVDTFGLVQKLGELRTRGQGAWPFNSAASAQYNIATGVLTLIEASKSTAEGGPPLKIAGDIQIGVGLTLYGATRLPSGANWLKNHDAVARWRPGLIGLGITVSGIAFNVAHANNKSPEQKLAEARSLRSAQVDTQLFRSVVETTLRGAGYNEAAVTALSQPPGEIGHTPAVYLARYAELKGIDEAVLRQWTNGLTTDQLAVLTGQLNQAQERTDGDPTKLVSEVDGQIYNPVESNPIYFVESIDSWLNDAGLNPPVR